jgi:hypothetical protein
VLVTGHPRQLTPSGRALPQRRTRDSKPTWSDPRRIYEQPNATTATTTRPRSTLDTRPAPAEHHRPAG